MELGIGSGGGSGLSCGEPEDVVLGLPPQLVSSIDSNAQRQVASVFIVSILFIFVIWAKELAEGDLFYLGKVSELRMAVKRWGSCGIVATVWRLFVDERCR